MTKKYFSIILLILFSLQIQAQSFSIKITQVYPAGGVVYGESHNLSGELDKDEATRRNQYTGKDANYTMELIRPSGKQIKDIQNIRWILVENGVKKNRKEKPIPATSYKEPTTVKIYECNNNGTLKGQENIINYDHRYEFLKSKEKITVSDYMPLDKCKLLANEYFTKNKVDTLFCEIKIYNSKGIVVDSTINNSKTYNEYLVKQEQIRNAIKQDSIKNATKQVPVIKVEAESSKIETKIVYYSKQDIENQLKQLLKEVKSLKKGSKDFRQKMNAIIEKADNIIVVMKLSSKKDFDRNKYFEGDLNDLKKGIEKLIEINKKK